MTQCLVEQYGPCLLVTFNDGKTLLLQSDTDQAAFAFSCGLIPDGSPLSQEWIDCDPTNITSCPDDYYSIARYDIAS